MNVEQLKNTEYFQIIQTCHPHLAKKIEWTWSYPEFYKFFDRTMSDTRDGQRQGFSKEVSDAFFELHLMHMAKFPKVVRESEFEDSACWGSHSKWGTL